MHDDRIVLAASAPARLEPLRPGVERAEHGDHGGHAEPEVPIVHACADDAIEQGSQDGLTELDLRGGLFVNHGLCLASAEGCTTRQPAGRLELTDDRIDGSRVSIGALDISRLCPDRIGVPPGSGGLLVGRLGCRRSRCPHGVEEIEHTWTLTSACTVGVLHDGRFPALERDNDDDAGYDDDCNQEETHGQSIEARALVRQRAGSGRRGGGGESFLCIRAKARPRPAETRALPHWVRGE
jgi:hypothetical protein